MKPIFSFGVIFILVLFQQCHCQSLKSSFNINCGGPSNERFTGDQGTIAPSWLNITGEPESPRDGGTGALVIEGGDSIDSYALKTHKWGPDESSIVYAISDLESGSWDCTLHFAETSGDWNIPGKRVFNAEISTAASSRTESNIDVYSTVGDFQSLTFPFKSFTVPSGGGENEITVKMTSVTGNPMISAITCAKISDTAPNKNLPLILGLSIGAAALILAGIAIYICVYRRKKKRKRKQSLKLKKLSIKYGFSTLSLERIYLFTISLLFLRFLALIEKFIRNSKYS